MPRKTYTVEGEDYLCRVPNASDKWALDGTLPILPLIDPNAREKSAADIMADPKKLLTVLARADAFLVRCGIAPKFIAESPLVIPDGHVALPEMSPYARIELYGLLMADFGFTREAAKSIAPLSETVEGSAPSTLSAPDTAEAPPGASAV
jgi:hypothetical protein